MAIVSDVERGTCRYHLGLPDAERGSSAMGALRLSLGAMFTVDQGIANLNESSAPRLRMLIAKLDEVERRIGELDSSAEFDSVGNMRRNPRARSELATSYADWQMQLLKLLGIHDMQGVVIGRLAPGMSLNGRWSR